MEPISLTVAIVSGVIAIGATLVALCRKQVSSVNNNHDAQSTDGVEVIIGGYTKTTTTSNGQTVVTETVNPTTIKIHETDSTAAAINALSRADGYNTNTVAGMNSGSNAVRDTAGAAATAAAAPTTPRAAPQAAAPHASQQPDAQLPPINLQDFAHLTAENRDIFSVQEFTLTKDGETITVRGLTSNTVSSNADSQHDAAHTQLCRNITSAIMPKINAMTSSLVGHVASSQQMHVQQSAEHEADGATEDTPLLPQPPALVQIAGDHAHEGDAL